MTWLASLFLLLKGVAFFELTRLMRLTPSDAERMGVAMLLIAGIPVFLWVRWRASKADEETLYPPIPGELPPAPAERHDPHRDVGDPRVREAPQPLLHGGPAAGGQDVAAGAGGALRGPSLGVGRHPAPGCARRPRACVEPAAAQLGVWNDAGQVPTDPHQLA